MEGDTLLPPQPLPPPPPPLPLPPLLPPLLLPFANFSTLFACIVLKLPQILVVLKAKSSTGVSLNSLLLELTGFIVLVSYQMFYDYPPLTYLEFPILITQDFVLLFLILHYNRKMKHSLIYATLFLGGWKLISTEKWIVDTAMSVCTLISAGSKLLQLLCLWRSRDSSRVSALTWALALYTCVVRIFTTIVTTGDTLVVVRFVTIAVLNLWVMVTVIYFKPRIQKRD